MNDALSENGIYLFASQDKTVVLDAVSHLGRLVKHTESQDSVTTQIEARLSFDYKRGQRGFSNCSLAPHSDQSLRSPPIRYLGLLFKKPALVGGSSTFVDMKLAYQKMATSFPEYLDDLFDPDTLVHRFDDVYTSVPVFSKGASNHVVSQVRFDELNYVSFSKVQAVQKLHDIVNELTVSVDLKQNQDFIVDNTRWLHGRHKFFGARSAERFLIAANSDDNPTLGFPSNFVGIGDSDVGSVRS